MDLTEDQLIVRTRQALGWKSRVGLVPILKGGSDRKFYRAQGDGGSVILMAYGPEREENRYYGVIGKFLDSVGAPVPRILAEDPENRLVWSEDLGAVDIWMNREQPWLQTLAVYQKLLQRMEPFYRTGFAKASAESLSMMPGFDEKLYHWERDYFYREFVGGVCGITLSAAELMEVEQEMSPLAKQLDGLPKSLVHRDFQSQNVMVRDGNPWVIDFQGMRGGTFFYDFASLFMDPYMGFDASRRSELERIALGLGLWKGSGSEFFRLLDAAAHQRLMQALGAYGFLGLKRGKTAFLGHIPTALGLLADAAARLDEAPALRRLIGRCQETRMQADILTA